MFITLPGLISYDDQMKDININHNIYFSIIINVPSVIVLYAKVLLTITAAVRLGRPFVVVSLAGGDAVETSSSVGLGNSGSICNYNELDVVWVKGRDFANVINSSSSN
jgi:hypothetical protein